MEADNLFLQEIQLMMHGYGDSAQPHLATARIVASATRQQIVSMIWRAEVLMQQQGARAVTPRDILFLLRNRPHKLRRLLQYFAFKSFKSSVNSIAVDADKVSAKDISLLAGADKSAKTPYKDIIKLIDNTGELRELMSCNGTSGKYDSVRRERDYRADQIAQHMDQPKYMTYVKARRACFVANPTQQSAMKFVEWLQFGAGETPLPKLTGQAVEILGYLAKEIVAEIVDVALLVRRDSCSLVPGGPLRPLTLRGPPNTSAHTLDSWPALSPAEVREALRRFTSSHVGFNNVFVRSCGQPLNQLFLAG